MREDSLSQIYHDGTIWQENKSLEAVSFITIKLSTFGAAISIADMRINSHPRTVYINSIGGLLKRMSAHFRKRRQGFGRS